MKKQKGFTLIELLAVIVVLGLLLAIAIPSVTKYVNQSRKKTLVTSINSYVDALIIELNNMSYTFTDEDTIYAVPIECISMEKGGSNPFGEWLIASEDYWGYVLVQYDKLTSDYRYGFTFMDSSGHGMYPTVIDKIDKSGNDIALGYRLNKPMTGLAVDYANKNKWKGFNINNTTNFVVLESDEEGNNKNICTVKQNIENIEPLKSYAVYSDDDKSLTFYRTRNEIKEGEKYNGLTVTAIYTEFDNKTFSRSDRPPWYEYKDVIEKVYVQGKLRPKNTSLWFEGLVNCSYLDVTDLDVSNVTDMSSMFKFVGQNTYSFKIVGLEDWDTSNVEKMVGLFTRTGENATEWNIGNLSGWDVSIVEDMTNMFSCAGRNAKVFDIGNLYNWNVSNVTSMNQMFAWTGGLESWYVGDLSNWDTGKVKNMEYMFAYAGQNAKKINIGNIGKWDVSTVETMLNMFLATGKNSETFYIGDLSSWNTKSVANLGGMFSSAGKKANWFIDCSSWNVSKVTNYVSFNDGVMNKVKEPVWVN